MSLPNPTRHILALLQAFVLLGIFSFCYAHALVSSRFGDWQVGVSLHTKSLYAGTIDSHGNMLGEYCFPVSSTCVWLLGLSIPCIKGHSYPVLANSDAGSSQINIQCEGHLSGVSYTYVFTDFNRIDHLVHDATKLVLALPLNGEQIQLVGFSMRGSIGAIQVMKKVASRIAKKTQPAGNSANALGYAV